VEKFTNRDKETLERLIDAYGLNSVCENIADVCHEKAEHIVASYSDNVTAATWNIAGVNMMVASEVVFSDRGSEDLYGMHEERRRNP
jgi:hypothetical protein